MKFGNSGLQRTKKIGAQLAVEIWMDYPPRELPEYWREAMVERGVGERKPDGTVRLTRRGRRLRAEVLKARGDERADNGGEISEQPRPSRAPDIPPARSPRPWREILSGCNDLPADVQAVQQLSRYQGRGLSVGPDGVRFRSPRRAASTRF